MRDIVVAVFLRNVNVIKKCKLSKMPFYARTDNLLIGCGTIINRANIEYIVQIQKTTIIVIVKNSKSISHWMCKRWLS